MRSVAVESDGWNRWGGNPERFASGVAALAEAAPPHFEYSWGGLVVLGADDADLRAKQDRLEPGPGTLVGTPDRVAASLAGYVEAGASWVIAGPIDSSDPENAALLGERIRPLLM